VAPAVLDIATVVYSRELPLLRLQACSMARYLDPAGIGRIVVVVNDIDEAACAARVEAMRAAWGRLAPRLEVVGADALFALRPAANGPRGPRQRFRLWFARNRRRYPLGVKRGWRGNRGWAVQQALKLAVARHGDSPMVLLLDAKNHFVKPVGLSSFVSPDGRALSFTDLPGDKRNLWIAGSFRLLGLPPPGRQVPSPPTVTPVVVPRAVLRGCLDAVERRVGPVEAFFARAKGDLSEFMLIYAFVAGHCGGWDAVFAPGLVPSASIHRRSDAAEIERVLARVEDGTAEIFSVHDSRLVGLAPDPRRRIEAIWRDRGLPGEGLLA
jgi:uncharacterized protein DUF6492